MRPAKLVARLPVLAGETSWTRLRSCSRLALRCSPALPRCAGTDQDRAGHRALRPVGARRRSDHARPDDRDRRDQCQRRRARPQVRAGAPRRRGDARQGRHRGARAAVQGEGRGAVRRPRHAGVARDRADRERGEGAVHGPWAAGTPITKNGANPNYVFRVSAVDEIVNRAMLQYAQKTFNAKKLRHDPGQQPLGRVERERPHARRCRRRA